MILFLDIDGVLHPDPPQPDQRLRALPRLVEILRDLPQVEVVISPYGASTCRSTSCASCFRLTYSSGSSA